MITRWPLSAALQPLADDRLGLPALYFPAPIWENKTSAVSTALNPARNERIQQLERRLLRLPVHPNTFPPKHDWGNFQSRISQFSA